ncbi:MAG: hypothetical protein DSZ07_07320 [Sulfurovum sp.]|nr:MAG: hypothetical protein DSZ07_07320 [Sulfurovum sp.]
MKKIAFILFIILGVISNSEASTRSDVKIIEASEDIRYLSQKIAKEYLYLYYNPNKINLRDKITNNMKKLKKSIEEISINTQNNQSKNILNFLTYSNEEIQILLNQKVSQDKSILMLDYSETFVEAANSIQFLHQYKFSNEEKMLMYLKELEYLLERVNKYYIASILNLNKISNKQHMNNALRKVEDIFKAIKEYPYPKETKEERSKIVNYWKNNKKFLNISKDLSVPNLLLLFSKNFEDSIKKLELYHKQNQ